MVTYWMPNVYTVSLIQSPFAESLAHMSKTAYFEQRTHLHDRANECLNKPANRHGKVSHFFGFSECDSGITTTEINTVQMGSFKL